MPNGIFESTVHPVRDGIWVEIMVSSHGIPLGMPYSAVGTADIIAPDFNRGNEAPHLIECRRHDPFNTPPILIGGKRTPY